MHSQKNGAVPNLKKDSEFLATFQTFFFRVVKLISTMDTSLVNA